MTTLITALKETSYQQVNKNRWSSIFRGLMCLHNVILFSVVFG